jgi:hypothetical protein
MPLYQRSAPRQKNSLPSTTAPFRTPEVAEIDAARFDPSLTPRWLPGSIRTDTKSRSSDTQEVSMFFIVEIQPNGTETFLEGFEELGDAWDVVSRLQCEAQRRRRRVRYEVR